MMDYNIEDLVEPLYTALKDLTEEQLGDLADALNRLQAAVDDELMRREAGEDEDDAEEDEEELDFEDAGRW